MVPAASDLARAAMGQFSAGHLAQAEVTARQAIAASKRDALAHAVLAKVLQQRGFPDQAVTHFNTAIKLAPRARDFPAMLAELLTNIGQFRRALDLYNRLERTGDFDPAVAAGKAWTLYRMKAYDRVLRHLQPLVDTQRDTPGMVATYLLAAHRLGKTQQGLDAAERHRGTADDAPPDQAAMYWFAVGETLEKQGDHDAAFEAYTRGNSCLGDSYDADADRALWAREREAFTREVIERFNPPDHPTDQMVFIVGMPRSGSTLVEQIIDAHPKAYGAGELVLLPNILNELPMAIESTLLWPECLRDMEQPDITRLSAMYLDPLRRPARNAERWLDKNLSNHRWLGLINILFPDARVIHCQRDPVQNCLSCFAQRFQPGQHIYTTGLESLAAAYRLHEEVMAYWQSTITLPLLTVQYETLIDDQEPETRRIIEFCGLPWDDRCLRFFESKRTVLTLSHEQVTQPIYRGSLDRAAKFGDRLDPLRDALAG